MCLPRRVSVRVRVCGRLDIGICVGGEWLYMWVTECMCERKGTCVCPVCVCVLNTPTRTETNIKAGMPVKP